VSVNTKRAATRSRQSATPKRRLSAAVVIEARRLAIATLDGYGCTVPEFCEIFKISEATFHRDASGIRLRPRPTEPILSMGLFEIEPPSPVPMTPIDGLEIAALVLLGAGYEVPVIVEALRGRTSKSSVYRLRTWRLTSRQERSEAQLRMIRRHLASWPDYGYLRPEERRLEAQLKSERWVTRGRGQSSD
jgi:hypothetical protein